jgi:hypothetical protein
MRVLVRLRTRTRTRTGVLMLMHSTVPSFLFEGNRLIDLRLARHSRKREREQPRGDACKHPAQQQLTDHVLLR